MYIKIFEEEKEEIKKFLYRKLELINENLEQFYEVCVNLKIEDFKFDVKSEKKLEDIWEKKQYFNLLEDEFEHSMQKMQKSLPHVHKAFDDDGSIGLIGIVESKIEIIKDTFLLLSTIKSAFNLNQMIFLNKGLSSDRLKKNEIKFKNCSYEEKEKEILIQNY